MTEVAHLGKGAIRDYAWSPDGELIAVATSLGVYLYEATTLAERQFVPTDAPARAVAFSPDGAILAGSVADNSLHLWKVDGGNPVRELVGHTQPAFRLAFSPDGRWLASGVADQTLRLWDVNSGRQLHALPAHPQSRFMFSPDGRWLAIGGGKLNRQVQIWDPTTGEMAYQLEIAPDLTGWAFSADSRILAVLPSGERVTPVLFWDFAAGQTRRLQHAESIRGLAFSPDGSTLATGDFGRKVRLWDVESGQMTRTLGEHADFFFDLVFSPDGQLLVSADTAGMDTIRLKVWDVNSGTARLDLGVSAVSQLAFSPNGEFLAFRQGGALSLLNVKDGRTQFLPGHSDLIASLAFSPDRETLAAGDWHGLVQLWHLSTGQPFRVLAGHIGPVGSLTFHPDGQILASAGINEDRAVQLWDVRSGQLLDRFEGDPGYPMHGLTFSPDGRFLAGGGLNGAILHDVTTGETRRLNGHTQGVLSVAISPDNKLLASGSFDETVIVWDLESGEALYTLPEIHEMGAVGLSFSPDGKWLISGDQQGKIRGWNVETGKLLRTLEGQGNDTALSPDGKLLAFKKTNDDLVMWDVNSGREVHHGAASRPIAFDPEGVLLASGSPDGIITLWGVKSRDL